MLGYAVSVIPPPPPLPQNPSPPPCLEGGAKSLCTTYIIPSQRSVAPVLGLHAVHEVLLPRPA